MFCDTFDAFAGRWEKAQRELVRGDCKRCDVCAELKPPWMTDVCLVHGGSALPQGLRGGSEAWQAYVAQHCVDKWLCTRCRKPTAEEKRVGVHKFSKANDALLRPWPTTFDPVQLEAQLERDPYAAFAIATDAELALVRMTIPWCASSGVSIAHSCVKFSPRGPAIALCSQYQAQSAQVRWPLVIAHFEDYRGPAFFPQQPKWVMLPPVERQGDCRCCSRYGACFRVCEGTTVHSVEGITVGARRQVKRLGISLGPATVEQRARGSSYVALSRPETTDDYCFMTPVDQARFGAIGTGKAAEILHRKLDALTSKPSTDADTLLDAGLYEPLLVWAETLARHMHHTNPPWRKEAHVAAYLRLGGAAVTRASVFTAPSTQSTDSSDARASATASSTSAPLRSHFFADSDAPIDTEVPSPVPDDGTMLMLEGLVHHYERERRRNGKRKAQS